MASKKNAAQAILDQIRMTGNVGNVGAAMVKAAHIKEGVK